MSAPALSLPAGPRLPDDEVLRLAFEATGFLDDAERATVHAVLGGTELAGVTL